MNQVFDDTSREGFRWIKLMQIFKLVLPWNSKTVSRVSKVADLDLKALEGRLGKEYACIIFDFDETLAPNHGEILAENFEYISGLVRNGKKIVIFSNMIETPRYAELKKIGVQVCRSPYPKPDARGFEECCVMTGATIKECLMVGDSFITDGGAIRAGMDFVKVTPIPTDEPRFSRLRQKITRLIVEAFAHLWDFVLRRG